MELRKALLYLEDPAARIKGGINALGIMSTGLSSVKDPYAEGFNAIWNYLADAELDFQKQLTSCLNTEAD